MYNKQYSGMKIICVSTVVRIILWYTCNVEMSGTKLSPGHRTSKHHFSQDYIDISLVVNRITATCFSWICAIDINQRRCCFLLVTSTCEIKESWKRILTRVEIGAFFLLNRALHRIADIYEVKWGSLEGKRSQTIWSVRRNKSKWYG